jgi:DNA-binding MarR family transcriptional regulator
VALTRKGTLLFEEVFPAHLQHLQRAFGRLDDSELKRLRESLSQLQDAFEKEHAR